MASTERRENDHKQWSGNDIYKDGITHFKYCVFAWTNKEES
jgi:hypothetical protein